MFNREMFVGMWFLIDLKRQIRTVYLYAPCRTIFSPCTPSSCVQYVPRNRTGLNMWSVGLQKYAFYFSDLKRDSVSIGVCFFAGELGEIPLQYGEVSA